MFRRISEFLIIWYAPFRFNATRAEVCAKPEDSCYFAMIQIKSTGVSSEHELQLRKI